MIFLQVAHRGARVAVGILVAQAARQMGRDSAPDDVRAPLQRAEGDAAGAALIQVALEHHFAPRRLVNLGDLAFGGPVAPILNQGLPVGIEGLEQMSGARTAHGVERLHQALLLREHAQLGAGSRQGDGEGDGAVGVGADFRFR